MIFEYVYRVGALVLSIENPRPTPVQGSRLKVSGDPDRLPVDGLVLATRDLGSETLLYIEVNDGSEGALDLISWLTTNGDVGIMVVEGEPESEPELEQEQ